LIYRNALFLVDGTIVPTIESKNSRNKPFFSQQFHFEMNSATPKKRSMKTNALREGHKT